MPQPASRGRPATRRSAPYLSDRRCPASSDRTRHSPAPTSTETASGSGNNAAVRVGAFHRFAVNCHPAIGWLEYPGDQVQQRGFSAAGRSEQGDEFAGADVDVEIIERNHRPGFGLEAHGKPEAFDPALADRIARRLWRGRPCVRFPNRWETLRRENNIQTSSQRDSQSDSLPREDARCERPQPVCDQPSLTKLPQSSSKIGIQTTTNCKEDALRSTVDPRGVNARWQALQADRGRGSAICLGPPR